MANRDCYPSKTPAGCEGARLADVLVAIQRLIEPHVATAGFNQVLLAILAVLLVVDIGLARAAMARFQRSRLDGQ